MSKDKSVRTEKLKNVLKEKTKSLLGPVLILLLIVIGILIIAFWKEEETPEEIVKVNTYEGNSSDIVLENENLKMVMDPETTQFTVTKKSTGAIWYSNPQDADEDTVALKSDIENLKSTLLLTYSVVNGVDTLYNNYKYSISSKIFNIEATENSIKVDYSIGEVEKEYIIPLVAEEERMEELLGNMSKGDASMVKDYYKKYDINNLGKKDDKEALLEQYPILEEKVIYVLRDGVKDNLKKKLEEFFSEAGYTDEEYAVDKELYAQSGESDKPVFNVSIEYRLEGDDLVVTVPMSEIEYKDEYPIISLTILPYFGAGGTEEDGYMLVPEGGGSIIRFNNGKLAQNSYYSNVYGWDMAQGRDYLVHETRAYYGAYGIAKGDASYLCILEDGASYASVSADISGRTNSYNYVNANFTILHREQCDVADKYNGEMFMYEQQIPDENLVERFRFVDTGNYVDMANAYHDYLGEKYGEAFDKNTDETVPVAVEVIGAVDKVEQILGVPVSRPLALTTYEETQKMLQEIKESGVSNLSVKMSGWMNGGINQKILKDVDLISDLGSKKDIKSLLSYAEENDIDIYLDGVTNYANDSGVSDGFLVFRDAARLVSKEKVELLEYDTVYYGEQDWKDPYYLLKPTLVTEMMQNLSDAAAAYGAQGVSFRDTGYQLSADYNQKELVTRQTALNMQLEELENIKASGLSVMTNMGNDYVLETTDFITNMDLKGSNYTIIDETVPFYQIAIHGYVNYTGKALNLSGDYQEELLKAAEYGAGLYFVFMDAESTELQNTYYTQYFGSNYDSWKDEMLEIYSRYDAELGKTYKQRITNHEVLDEGITLTAYEDGTKVYVNYSSTDYKIKSGITLPARDYMVIQ